MSLILVRNLVFISCFCSNVFALDQFIDAYFDDDIDMCVKIINFSLEQNYLRALSRCVLSKNLDENDNFFRELIAKRIFFINNINLQVIGIKTMLCENSLAEAYSAINDLVFRNPEAIELFDNDSLNKLTQFCHKKRYKSFICQQITEQKALLEFKNAYKRGDLILMKSIIKNLQDKLLKSSWDKVRKAITEIINIDEDLILFNLNNPDLL